MFFGTTLCLGVVPADAQQTNYDSATTNSQQIATELATASPPQPLFGDWDGVRTDLDDLGITLKLDYTSETAWNASGGRHQGADYAQQIELQADIDWQKLAGIPGFSMHTILVNRAGRNASVDYIGDPVIQAQEIYGAGFGMAAKLVYLYGEEKLWNDRLDVAVGRLAVGADFAASPLYCDFMTLTICGHPRALTSNQGFTDYPLASWGGRVHARITSDISVMTGIYESIPFPAGGRSGWDWFSGRATGATFPAEIAWEPLFGHDQLPGHYKVGIAYDDSSFSDYFSDALGKPFLISGDAARQDHGRTSIWITADQMLLRNGPGPDAGLILLAAYAHNSPNVSQFEHFVWLGVIDRGFWPARAQDRIGFAVTYYKLSPSLTALEVMQQNLDVPFTNGEIGVQSDAFVLEVNYDISVYRGVDVQPELEYFIRPGGQRAVANAFVPGLKVHVLF